MVLCFASLGPATDTALRLHNFRSLYRIGLTRTRLPIGEYCAVIPLQATLSDRFSYRVEDHALLYRLGADEIKLEILLVCYSIKHDCAAICGLNTVGLSNGRGLLAFIQWSDTDAYLDVVFLVGFKD